MAEPGQHLEPFQVLPQLEQQRLAGTGCIRLDDTFQDLAAAVAQLRAEGILVITAEVAHDLFDVPGQIKSSLVDGQMLITRHFIVDLIFSIDNFFPIMESIVNPKQ